MRIRRRVALFLGVALAGLLGMTGVAAAANGTISGTVTRGDNSTAVGSGEVRVNVLPSSGGTPAAQVLTDSSGAYSASVPPGTYRLFFQPTAGTLFLQQGFAGSSGALVSVASVSSATDFVVADGGSVTRSQVLPVGGNLSGTVTRPGGSALTAPGSGNAPFVTVQVFSTTSSGAPVGIGGTADDGSYFVVVPTGTYRVVFVARAGSNLASDQVASVSLTNSQTTAQDRQLAAGGAFTGTVTSAGSPVGTGQVIVTAYPATGNTSWPGSVPTNSSGVWSMGGIPLGQSWKLSFQPASGVSLRGLWSGGASNINDATTVAMPSGSPSTVTFPSTGSFAMSAGVSITGTVTGTSGPVTANQVCVTAFQVVLGAQTAPSIASGCTNSSGVYTISGLPPSSPANQVKVLFIPQTGVALKPEWNSDKVNYAAADIVTAPATINATLAGGSAITGTVTNSSSTAVGANAVCVQAYGLVTGADFGPWVAGACTNSSGAYYLAGLDAGTSYKLQFQPGSAGNGLRSAWSGGATSYLTATAVAAGATVNIQLQAGFSISGTVTRSDGATTLVSQVCVNAFSSIPNADYGPWVAGTCVADGGGYTLPGLAPGSYRVQFYPQGGSNLRQQWYNAANSYAAASVITIGSSNVSSIDGALASGASISGSLTSGGTAVGVGAVCATAYTNVSGANWGEFAGGSCTKADGTYSISGLPSGNYRVFFGPGATNGSSLKAEWYNDKSSYADAAVVAAGTANVDADLNTGAQISGTVSASSGPVQSGFVCVNAYTVEANRPYGDWAAGTCTNGSGQYSLSGLAPGSYKLFYDARPGSGLRSGWYDGKTSYEAGGSVTAPASNVNQTLSAGVTISGTVSSSGGPVGANKVCINAFSVVANADYGPWIGGACTRSDGTYAIAGIPSGSYKLQFWPQVGSSLRQTWSGNQPTYRQASTVSAPGTSSVTLASGASISGTVTRPGSSEGADGSQVPQTAGAGQVCVSAFADVAGAQWGEWVSSSCTKSDGTYSIDGLTTSTSYRLQFQSAPGSLLRSEWYSDASKYQTATAVASGSSGINAQLDGGVSIGGVVQGSSGAVGPGAVCVLAFVSVTNAQWGDFTAGGCTRADGSYAISGLPSGTYRLQFQAMQAGLRSEWNADKTSYAAADPVSATAATTTVNATLASGQSISGVVSDSGGPVADLAVCVSAYTDGATAPFWGTWAGGTCARSNGAYTISGLAPGSYRLLFQPQGTNTLTAAWFGGGTTYAAATVVDVSSADATGRNVTLSSGGSITGQVQAPATGRVCLAARVVGQTAWQGVPACVDITQANTNVAFRLNGLAPANYQVVFWDPDGSPGPQWYRVGQSGNTEPEPGTPDSVTVTNNATTTLSNVVVD